MKICQVCLASCDGRIRNGIVACQACKSFFLRCLSTAKNELNLKCVTGLGNCISDDELPMASDGRRLRFFCKKCRYLKCKAVGMRGIQVRNSTDTSNGQNSPQSIEGEDQPTASSSILMPVNHLEIDKTIKAEQMLHGLVSCFRLIENSYERAPGLVWQLGENRSESNIISCFLTGGDYTSKVAASFVKNNPFYKPISLHDRCVTFFRGSTRLKRIFSSAPGMLNNCNYQAICSIIPEFISLRSSCLETIANLGQFQFNFQEYAFLASFLFFFRMG